MGEKFRLSQRLLNFSVSLSKKFAANRSAQSPDRILHEILPKGYRQLSCLTSSSYGFFVAAASSGTLLFRQVSQESTENSRYVDFLLPARSGHTTEKVNFCRRPLLAAPVKNRPETPCPKSNRSRFGRRLTHGRPMLEAALVIQSSPFDFVRVRPGRAGFCAVLPRCSP